MYKLVISDDEGKTTVVPLVRDEITIGRKEGNTIRLTERNVSRRHARLQKQNGHYLLQDLGSYNGIVINGGRLNETRPLRPGDQILIGDYKLAILEEGAASHSMPAAPPTNGAEGFDGMAVSGGAGLSPMSTAPAIPSALNNASANIAPMAFADAVARERASMPPTAPALPVAGGAHLPNELQDLRLVFLAPPGAPPPVNVDRLPLILGRSEAADVVLPYSSISREHARLSLVNGELVIEDLGSSNGLTINGNKLPSGPLAPGDLVALGVVEMRVARRGDETIMVATAGAPKKRSAVPILAGVMGGGAVLGLMAFVFLRSPGTPSSSARNNTPSPTLSSPPPTTPLPTTNPQTVAMGGPTPSANIPQAVSPVGEPAVPPNPAIAAVVPEPVIPPPPPTPLPPGPAVGAPPTIDPATPTAVEPPATVASSARRPTAAEERHGTQRSPNRQPDERHRPGGGMANPASPTPDSPTVASHPTPVAPVGPSRPSLTGSAPPAAPVEEAMACHGEPSCMISALRNRAQTERELGMLAVAYRQRGQRGEAVRTMNQYLGRFGNGPRAESFRAYINNE